jgi:hypothetical protein
VGHDADIPIVLERCRSWHASLCGSGTAWADPASDSKKRQAPANTRVDQSFPGAGTGIHPPSRRVHSPLLHEWGPMARRGTASAFNCPASLFGMSHAGRLTHGFPHHRVDRGPVGADAQLVGTFSRDRNGWSQEPCNLDRAEPKVNAALAPPVQRRSQRQ